MLAKVKELYRQDDCRSKSEFIEKAIRFYIGCLSAEDGASYLPNAFLSNMKSIVAESDNRHNKMIFKLAVELAMLMNVVAASSEIDEISLALQKLRSSFAKDIFAQDLLCIYEKQTEHRNRLRSESRDVLAEIVSQINAGGYSNPHLEELLLQLARRLSRTKGKKVYGYLKADVKALIDSIVDGIAKDNRISALYDLWYEQRENVLRTYNGSLPERVPLSQNKEFKSIKNAVIQAAMDLTLDSQQGQIVAEDDIEIQNRHSPTIGNAGIGMNALRLFQQTSQILQNEVRPIYQDKRVDRKLRRKINEKKQAQGLRQ